jgi:hypothetical protein
VLVVPVTLECYWEVYRQVLVRHHECTCHCCAAVVLLTLFSRIWAAKALSIPREPGYCYFCCLVHDAASHIVLQLLLYLL